MRTTLILGPPTHADTTHSYSPIMQDHFHEIQPAVKLDPYHESRTPTDHQFVGHVFSTGMRTLTVIPQHTTSDLITVYSIIVKLWCIVTKTLQRKGKEGNFFFFSLMSFNN